MAELDKRLQRLLGNYDEHCRRIERATQLNLAESPVERAERIARLEDKYTAWFEYYFPTYAKVPCAWFHEELANNMIGNTEICEMAEIYRSGAKSVHIDLGIPLFLMYTGRMKFMLLIGQTEQKAKKLLSACQAQIKHNKLLESDYGPKFKHGDWAEGDFVTVDGVRFMSLGFGQDPRGVREEADRPDYIAVDDIDNRKHVNNNRMMREAVEWIFEDLMGCFDDMDGAVRRFVYANNNFHKNSITNRLKTQFRVLADKSRQSGERPIHHVLTVRAVKDLNTFEPNWPEKTTAEYWRRKFQNTPYRSFMREFMHTHIEDGAVFRFEDMQWKEFPPLKEYDALAFYGDLSYKTAACHKGMILIGKYGREFHVIHVFLRQSTRALLAKWLYDLYEERLEHCRKIKYEFEGLFAMDTFVNDFDAEGDERGFYIPVRASKEPKGDKYERIEATQPHFERRNVWFNAAERDSPDQIELIDQFLAFEKGSGAPVDGPDAFEGALSRVNHSGRKQRTQHRHGARPNRKY